jgi:hypothetical protein
MVKRVPIVILIVLTCLVCLTTCDLLVTVLSLSPFPGYLAQAVASVDMWEEVEKFLGEDPENWGSEVYVLRDTSGAEGVFLIVHKYPGGQWVYAFNTSLELISKAYLDYNTNVHLVAVVPAPISFVVGNISFDPASLAVNGPIDTGAGEYTFSYGSNNMDLWSHYDDGTGESFLEIRYYDGWPLSSPSATTAPSVLIGGNDVELWGLTHDIEAGLVFLFFYNHEGEYVQVSEVPSPEFPNFPSLTSQILSDYPTSPPVDRVKDRFFCSTRKGFVASARTRGFFLRFNLAGDELQRFYIGVEDDRGIDFDIEGEYYYVFNRSNYRLYKANTGF